GGEGRVRGSASAPARAGAWFLTRDEVMPVTQLNDQALSDLLLERYKARSRIADLRQKVDDAVSWYEHTITTFRERPSALWEGAGDPLGSYPKLEDMRD